MSAHIRDPHIALSVQCDAVGHPEHARTPALLHVAGLRLQLQHTGLLDGGLCCDFVVEIKGVYTPCAGGSVSSRKKAVAIKGSSFAAARRLS